MSGYSNRHAKLTTVTLTADRNDALVDRPFQWSRDLALSVSKCNEIPSS